MDKSMFRFDLVDKYVPYVVIEKHLGQIEEATNGYVVGKIENYFGPISSYTKPSGLRAALSAVAEKETVVDVQEGLGALNADNNRFEVYLSAKGLGSYKFRIMFVDYGTVSYPVTVVLAESLARAYNENRMGDTYIIESMDQLNKLMDTVLNSEYLIYTIQNLINEAIRREQESETMGV